jgi:CheY-like chemotaxis protein
MRVLACTVPEVEARLRAVLPDAELHVVFREEDALRLLDEQVFDLLIIGMAFDESRALPFLQRIRSDPALRKPPVVGIRGGKVRVQLPPHVFDTPMRALGAFDVIDLSTIADDEAGNREVAERMRRGAGATGK